MTQLGADNRYIESNIEYGSGRLDIAIWYRERAMLIEQKAITLAELKKLGIEREYNDLDAATDEEKSRIPFSSPCVFRGKTPASPQNYVHSPYAIRAH